MAAPSVIGSASSSSPPPSRSPAPSSSQSARSSSPPGRSDAKANAVAGTSSRSEQMREAERDVMLSNGQEPAGLRGLRANLVGTNSGRRLQSSISSFSVRRRTTRYPRFPSADPCWRPLHWSTSIRSSSRSSTSQLLARKIPKILRCPVGLGRSDVRQTSQQMMRAAEIDPAGP